MNKLQEIQTRLETIIAQSIDLDEATRSGAFSFKEEFLKCLWQIELTTHQQALEQAQQVAELVTELVDRFDDQAFDKDTCLADITDGLQELNKTWYRILNPKRGQDLPDDLADGPETEDEPEATTEINNDLADTPVEYTEGEPTVDENVEDYLPDPILNNEPPDDGDTTPEQTLSNQQVKELNQQVEQLAILCIDLDEHHTTERLEFLQKLQPVCKLCHQLAIDSTCEPLDEEFVKTVTGGHLDIADEEFPQKATACLAVIKKLIHRRLNPYKKDSRPVPADKMHRILLKVDEQEEQIRAELEAELKARELEQQELLRQAMAEELDDPKAPERGQYFKEEFDPDESDEDFLREYLAELTEFVENLENEILNVREGSSDPESINTIFRLLHTIKGNAGIMDHKKLGEIAHEAEDLMLLVREGTITMNAEMVDAVLTTSDVLKAIIVQLSVETPQESISDDDYIYILSLLRATRKKYENGEPEIEESLVEELPDEPDDEPITDVEPDAIIDEHPIADEPAEIVANDRPPIVHDDRQQDSVRINTQKLDMLIDMVGEMVITSNLMIQDEVIKSSKSLGFHKKVAQMSRAVSDLQKVSMRLRMIPIGSTFQKMKRVVHEYTRHTSKRINLIIQGKDTEIDRNIVNRLYEPLVHMIRNSCDHGIEEREKRKQAGKPAIGNITLDAYHKGDNIVIEISDDGFGLDKNKIKAKAIEKGLINPEDDLNERETLLLITRPGFSTAEKVTDISGRGVGMDVVNQVINSLRGRLEIVSTPGKGSTFRILLPLTLAIIEGMLIKTGDEIFVIPVINVKRFIQPRKELITNVFGKGETYKLDGEMLPIVHLRKALNIPNAKTNLEDCLLIVINSLSRDYGLVVDSLIGIQDVVVKKLSEALSGMKEYSGSTILGNGEVSLIIDVNSI